jgi:predicted nucleotide-binding protein (sugar kinase/HSP70/actin superfamily)
VPTYVENVMDTASCPVVAGTPKVVKSAFTKETDFFAERNIEYLDPAVSLSEPLRFKKLMFDVFGERLGITEDENDWAMDQGWAALKEYDRQMEEKGKEILEEVAAEDRMALLMIGRPYHNDPGMNHEVLEEFQSLGYPILSMRSIPKDKEWLNKYFAEDLRKKHITSALDINDVWPENYSVNSVQKVWCAKFASRHPNVAVLDLSSFKCGHDAPTYGLIESITAAAGSPYSALHDIDANKPAGSIKIRVKTYGYTLMLAKEKLEDDAKKKVELERKVLAKKLQLMEEMRNKLQLLSGTRDIALEKRIAEQQNILATLTPEDSGRRQLSVLQ